MDHADLYEWTIDSLKIKYAHWLFDPNTNKAIEPEIADFLRWLIKSYEEDLHAPRSPDSKSFYQRREEAKS